MQKGQIVQMQLAWVLCSMCLQQISSVGKRSAEGEGSQLRLASAKSKSLAPLHGQTAVTTWMSSGSLVGVGQGKRND